MTRDKTEGVTYIWVLCVNKDFCCFLYILPPLNEAVVLRQHRGVGRCASGCWEWGTMNIITQ